MKVPLGTALLGVIGLVVIAGFIYAVGHKSTFGIQQNPAYTNGPIFVVASSTGENYFEVDKTGNVGIRRADPATALDIYGMIRIYTASQAAIPCTEAIAGAIQYDAWSLHFYGCNGTKWRILDSGP